MFRDEISMQDLNEQKWAKTCKEVTIAWNFLERLKARTDQFRKYDLLRFI